MLKRRWHYCLICGDKSQYQHNIVSHITREHDAMTRRKFGLDTVDEVTYHVLNSHTYVRKELPDDPLVLRKSDGTIRLEEEH